MSDVLEALGEIGDDEEFVARMSSQHLELLSEYRSKVTERSVLEQNGNFSGGISEHDFYRVQKLEHEVCTLRKKLGETLKRVVGKRQGAIRWDRKKGGVVTVKKSKKEVS